MSFVDSHHHEKAAIFYDSNIGRSHDRQPCHNLRSKETEMLISLHVFHFDYFFYLECEPKKYPLNILKINYLRSVEIIIFNKIKMHVFNFDFKIV